MVCDRCAEEPDADLTRYVGYEGNQEVLGFALCPKCTYGLTMLMRAYVANREVAVVH